MLSNKQSEHSFSPSAPQLSKPGLCNFKLCVTSGGMQKVLSSYLSAFATSYAFQAHNISL